jgi:hypothetical protein
MHLVPGPAVQVREHHVGVEQARKPTDLPRTGVDVAARLVDTAEEGRVLLGDRREADPDFGDRLVDVAPFDGSGKSLPFTSMISSCKIVNRSRRWPPEARITVRKESSGLPQSSGQA